MSDINSGPKVTIVIVTWNSMLYLFDCMESLMHQSFRDFSVVIIDNDSKDSTVEFVRSHYPTATVLQNFKNNGFSKANNQGIKISRSEYVLIMNPDIIMTENYLHHLVEFADSHKEAASVGGKLLKLFSQDVDPDTRGEGLRTAVRSDIIDTTGLKVFRNRQVVDRGEGDKDTGQYQRTEEVFGVSGACVMYRREALEDVKIMDEYFDENFFAYKEDIDLAWRLRMYGWQNWYVPSAVAYHHRRFHSSKSKSPIKKIATRRNVSKILRGLSFKNHHLMLVKNTQGVNFAYHFFPIVFRECKVIIYTLIFEPFVFNSLVKVFQHMPQILMKRKTIMKNLKIGPKQMRKWFK